MTRIKKPFRRTSTNKISKSRYRLFRTVLLLIPVLFFVLVELALRLFDFGGNLDLFVPGPGRLEPFYFCNQNVARRYFLAYRQVPAPANDYFRKQKPANGFRVFVLGGSTTNGYPYGSNLMFSRILEFRLKQALPDRTVEVVNVAMAAVNSYALLDFFDEILRYEPDALLIYAGHNEFYGALGVASMINLGSNRTFILAYMKLSRLKIFLAVRRFVLWLRNRGKDESLPRTATLMERMVAKQSIPLNSALYRAACRQFEGNLRAMLRKATKARIPVLLSDLVSNTRDQAPFISPDDGESASDVYRDAVALVDNGDYDAARERFKRARDLDVLRFRAPSVFNEIIRRVAIDYNIAVVEMEATFEAVSPDGLVGEGLMLDHLHPNIAGYFIMADAFFAAMRSTGIMPESHMNQLSIGELRRIWGYSRLDSLYGDLAIKALKGGWPFQSRSNANTAIEDFNPHDFVEEIAKRVVKYDNVSIREGHEILADFYVKAGDLEEALREYRALVALKVNSALPYLKVCEALIKSNNVTGVPRLIDESLIFDESPLSYILLGEAYNGLGRYGDAILAFEQAKHLGAPPDDPHVAVGLTYAYRSSGKTGDLKGLIEQSPRGERTQPKFSDVLDLLENADALIRDSRYDQARLLLEKSLKIQETGQAHKWLGQIFIEKKQPESAVVHLEKARLLIPSDPLLLYNLSIALVQIQNYERAWIILQEIERIDPIFEDRYDLRTKLANIINIP
jgi:tetratricopeptide (TPR) repeat protein